MISIQETVFSVCCGTSALLLYSWLYVYILKNLPQSFTFGEASVVSQGFVLFLLNVGLRFFEFSTYNADQEMVDMSLILQVSSTFAYILIKCETK